MHSNHHLSAAIVGGDFFEAFGLDANTLRVGQGLADSSNDLMFPFGTEAWEQAEVLIAPDGGSYRVMGQPFVAPWYRARKADLPNRHPANKAALAGGDKLFEGGSNEQSATAIANALVHFQRRSFADAEPGYLTSACPAACRCAHHGLSDSSQRVFSQIASSQLGVRD